MAEAVGVIIHRLAALMRLGCGVSIADPLRRERGAGVPVVVRDMWCRREDENFLPSPVPVVVVKASPLAEQARHHSQHDTCRRHAPVSMNVSREDRGEEEQSLLAYG